ncbi:hypothetical protein FB009_1233 [Sinorhizobium medicae]|nr:hypothetical protein FB009_1233 [Sinorhizobium medicae]
MPKDLDCGELVAARLFQSLCQTWREGERAAIGQRHNDAAASLVIAHRCSTRLCLTRYPATIQSCVTISAGNLA